MGRSVAVCLAGGGLFSLGKNSPGLSWGGKKRGLFGLWFHPLTRRRWERVTFIFQIMIHTRGVFPVFDLGELLMIYSRRTAR